eukprot:501941_1
MTNINTKITVAYVVIQVTIAVFVSIVGAVHVKRCINESKSNTEESIKLSEGGCGGAADRNKSDDIQLNKSDDIQLNKSRNEETTISIEYNVSPKKKQESFCELWAKTVWKMKGVYSSLVVHCFDVLSDVLVILQWLNTPNVDDDNIDPQVMAYTAIFVILFSKTFSTVAIYIKEQKFTRALLQFLDLLIFQEIYEAHNKIKHQINKKDLKDKNTTIESTLSFKYIRQMEAVFESIPESVLQLVYVLRTSSIKTIFVLSIIQSMISMTNSVLNQDYTRMQEEKWKKYKQKLPPTIQFFKHAMFRFSEVAYRVGLLSLLWTVCGGFIFSIIAFIELLIITSRTIALFLDGIIPFNADSMVLAFNSLIIIPSEEMYVNFETDDGRTLLFCCVCAWLGVCGGMLPWLFILFGVLVAKLKFNIDDSQDLILIPSIRANTSYLELVFLVFWGVFSEHGERKKFLLSVNHGGSIFITTCIFFVIYTQFAWLFPNFSLPFNVNARSKWGYAYANEFGELTKMKLPKFPYVKKLNLFNKAGKWEKISVEIQNKQQFWDETTDEIRIDINIDDVKDLGYGLDVGAKCRIKDKNIKKKIETKMKSLSGIYTIEKIYTMNNRTWLRVKHFPSMTSAAFAMAKQNDDIVKWLQLQGSVTHINEKITEEEIKEFL